MNPAHPKKWRPLTLGQPLRPEDVAAPRSLHAIALAVDRVPNNSKRIPAGGRWWHQLVAVALGHAKAGAHCKRRAHGDGCPPGRRWASQAPPSRQICANARSSDSPRTGTPLPHGGPQACRTSFLIDICACCVAGGPGVPDMLDVRAKEFSCITRRPRRPAASCEIFWAPNAGQDDARAHDQATYIELPPPATLAETQGV